MDQGYLEQRLQVPTGSKRPRPSPFEGEEDWEIKKFRTQPSNSNEDRWFQTHELDFPFPNLPGENFSNNQLDTFWSSQDAHGMSFSTDTGFNMGYDGPSAAFTTGDPDYETNLGDELATAAMDVNPEPETDLCCRDFSLNPCQGFESYVDTHVLDGARNADQYGDLITDNVGGHTWINDRPVGERGALVAYHDSPSGIDGWRNVESIPIRRPQVYEPPLQSLAASFPKEFMDVRKSCDTCFGGVGHCFLPLGDLSDSSKGDSNSHVIVHAGGWDPLYSCRPQTIWGLFCSSGSGFRYTRWYFAQSAAHENT